MTSKTSNVEFADEDIEQIIMFGDFALRKSKFDKAQLVCDYPKQHINFCNTTYLNTPIVQEILGTSNFTAIDQQVEKYYYTVIGQINNSTVFRGGRRESDCAFLYRRALCIQNFPTCYYTPLIEAKACVQLCFQLFSVCRFNASQVEICGTSKTPKPTWGKNLCVPGDGTNPVEENSYLIIFFLFTILGSGILCTLTLIFSNIQFCLQFFKNNG
eukprot:gene11762-5100_t